MVRVDNHTPCNHPWYKKKTSLTSRPTSSLKPVSLQTQGSSLSHWTEGPGCSPCDDRDQRCCPVWALLWEILSIGIGLHAAGCWHPFSQEGEHRGLCLAKVCFWGLRKWSLSGRLFPGLLEASTCELFVFVQGRKFPVHLILHFALKHKRGQSLVYKVYLTDS